MGTLLTTAASMSPRSWASVTMDSSANSTILLSGGSSGNIAGFAMNGTWYPSGGKLSFVGADHDVLNMRVIELDEATNVWTIRTLDTGMSGHNYGEMCVDPSTGDLYCRKPNNANLPLLIIRMLRSESNFSNYGTGSPNSYQLVDAPTAFWSGAALNGTGTGVGDSSLSSTGSGGSVVCWDNGNGYMYYIPIDTAVFQYDQVFIPAPAENNAFLCYSAVKNIGLFGGGNGTNQNKCWRLNQNRSVTAMPDCPLTMGIQKGNVACCPTSGHFIVMGDSTMYALDASAGSPAWVQLNQAGDTIPAGVNNPVGASNSALFSVPISSGGVIAYVSATASTTDMHLYKYSAGTSSPIAMVLR